MIFYNYLHSTTGINPTHIDSPDTNYIDVHVSSAKLPQSKEANDVTDVLYGVFTLFEPPAEVQLLNVGTKEELLHVQKDKVDIRVGHELLDVPWRLVVEVVIQGAGVKDVDGPGRVQFGSGLDGTYLPCVQYYLENESHVDGNSKVLGVSKNQVCCNRISIYLAPRANKSVVIFHLYKRITNTRTIRYLNFIGIGKYFNDLSSPRM